MANANSLANLRPWTPEDRAQRGQPFRTQTTSLIRYIRTQTLDGKEMADFMLAILRGEPIKNPKAAKRKNWPTIRDRMQAADWLANRAFGTPKETIEIADSESARQERLTLLQSLPSEARQALRAILTQALEAQAQEPPPLAPAPSTAPQNGGPHA